MDNYISMIMIFTNTYHYIMAVIIAIKSIIVVDNFTALVNN